jgi:hypothetical protein
VSFDEVEFVDSRLFDRPVFRDYEHDIEYSTDKYLDVLQTYSGHIALPPDARAGLLECIGKLISERYEGHIVKHYLWRLRVARRSA